MACFHPLTAYRRRGFSVHGKRSIFWKPIEGGDGEVVRIPCGACIGCRMDRARGWAVRCMHEASLYENNCFVTLTYDDEHLPEFSSLRHRDFQLFMKRLRRSVADPIRFYMAGEYGDRSGRPHYHTLLFNFDFSDKTYWTIRNDSPVWRSESLERLWPYGLSEIGSVTFKSACYVARYIMKKGGSNVKRSLENSEGDGECGVDLDTGVIGQVEPEYTQMSRRPGIGSRWFKQFGSEVYPSDGVVVQGRLIKPPRYYDKLLEASDDSAMEEVRFKRFKSRELEEETAERLVVREMVAKARANLYERGGV